ncbi:endonuclease/exonuclease/phosphatase family metal-dependent hydrolase [Roseibium marinum]|uniref:Endonuclease/exonuclease/phosphatase family metal-dependent hydrolase n=1 Tax=Roseibium marinum TaxID=281252 RepID=A0A2S3USD5_9HYPH|nr:endonuclease/exonuclease/phosphatase family metal-dependent hydrolase [Roseibium marinum]
MSERHVGSWVKQFWHRKKDRRSRGGTLSKTVLALAVLWLVFAITHEILTGRFWLWVVPGVSPPILFAAVPLVLAILTVFIRSYRGAVFLTALAAFVVSMPSTGLNFSVLTHRAQAVQPGLAVSVVQMNTDYWGQLRDGTLTDPRDRDAMLAYLRSLDADVYLLQEHMQRVGDTAPPVTDLSDVAEVFPEYQAIAAGTLLTLSRLPVSEHAVVRSDNPSILQLPPPPYALKVDVRVGGRVLSTYNIHMPIQIIIEKNWLSWDFYNEIRRRHSIRKDEFAALTAEVSRNQSPLVVAGDFNTSPAMGDNRGLLAVSQDAAAFSSIVYPATWRVGGQLPKLWRNDWFLIRNDIRVDRFEQLDPQGNSDHLAQFVGLTLTDQPEDAPAR